VVVQAAVADLAVEQVVQATLQQLLHHKEIMVEVLQFIQQQARVEQAGAELVELVLLVLMMRILAVLVAPV
jgi:flagellar biosynthesis/type III secretory pathway chaperone